MSDDNDSNAWFWFLILAFFMFIGPCDDCDKLKRRVTSLEEKVQQLEAPTTPAKAEKE